MRSVVRIFPIGDLLLATVCIFACFLGGAGRAAASPPPVPITELPRLIRELNNDDPKVQLEAIYGLDMLAAAPDEKLVPILPRLMELAQSDTANVRTYAIRLSGKFALLSGAEKQHPALVEAWSKALMHKDADTRLSVLSPLSAFIRGYSSGFIINSGYSGDAERTALALPHVMKALDDESADVREAAAGALALCGPPAKVAIGALIRTLDDESGKVRCAAATAVGAQRGAAAKAVPKLIELLRDDGQYVAARATYALQHMDSTAVKPLIAVVDDEDVRVRRGAVEALQYLAFRDQLPERIWPVLDRKLADEDVQVRYIAATRIAHQGPAEMKPHTVPALVEVLKKSTGIHLDQLNAARALPKCGQEGMEGLAVAMAANDPEVRMLAATSVPADAEGPPAAARAQVLLEALIGDDSTHASTAYNYLTYKPRDKLVQAIRSNREQLLPLVEQAAGEDKSKLTRALATKLLEAVDQQ